MKRSKLGMLALLSILAGCGENPTIDKVYNVVRIEAAGSSFSGDLTQSVEVAPGTKITLAYTNGLGREATVLMPDISGVYSEPYTARLAEGVGKQGRGTLELVLEGTPRKQGEIKLRPVIRVGAYEVFIELQEKVTPAMAFDASKSEVRGSYVLRKPITDGKIALHYTSFTEQTVTVSAAAVSGIEIQKAEYTLPASTSGSTVEIPVTGTPSNHGDQTLAVQIANGEDTYTVNMTIAVEGDMDIHAQSSSVEGDLFKDHALTDARILLGYDSKVACEVNVEVPQVNGIGCEAFGTVLEQGSGKILEIPLSGTPLTDGPVTLTVMIRMGDDLYTADLSANVIAISGIEFKTEKVIFHDLEYWTVFVDMNENGFVDSGEVWLDRNMGATSNDPGTYGTEGVNKDAVGHYYQWGKPYGTTVFDPAWGQIIDVAAMSPWANVCPDGYAVPTMSEWEAVVVAITGGTATGVNYQVNARAGMTEMLMHSPLKLPMTGWTANGSGIIENAGIRGAFWSATPGSNTAPWRLDIMENTETYAKGNWSGPVWQMPVRCIKK